MKHHPVVMSRILGDVPHTLTALELLRLGCSWRDLEDIGRYSTVELAQAYRYTKTLDERALCATAFTVLGPGRVVSGTYDVMIRIWCTETGKCIRSWHAESGLIKCLIVLRDGTILTAGGDELIKRWDPNTGICLQTVSDGHNDCLFTLAELSDGRIVSGGRRSMKVLDLSTGVCDITLEGHTDGIVVITELSNGLLASCSGALIRLWDLGDADESIFASTTAFPFAQCFDRCTHIIRGHWSDVTVLLQLRNGFLVSASTDGTIKQWDVGSRQSADHAISTVVLSREDCVLEIDGHVGGVNCLCLLNDGMTIVSGGGDRLLKIWDSATGNCLRSLSGHTRYVMCISLLADGVTLVSGSGDNTIRLWSYR
jgi:WD40 repeat protein